mmetsp:Transcript_14028/g.20522  ORF Transcript_14028/g.20522 Transcript_14028/m.20522 type:complete len:142 (-) Transcript_14028:44-469(-)
MEQEIKNNFIRYTSLIENIQKEQANQRQAFIKTDRKCYEAGNELCLAHAENYIKRMRAHDREVRSISKRAEDNCYKVFPKNYDYNQLFSKIKKNEEELKMIKQFQDCCNEYHEEAITAIHKDIEFFKKVNKKLNQFMLPKR